MLRWVMQVYMIICSCSAELRLRKNGNYFGTGILNVKVWKGAINRKE